MIMITMMWMVLTRMDDSDDGNVMIERLMMDLDQWQH
jgi:hypothetical protein